jgi:hypothetical protein
VIGIEGDADRRYLALLAADPPVLSRREGGRVILDLRAVPPSVDPVVAEALRAACRS